MNRTVNITPQAYETHIALLRRHLPDTEVWAYGSRVRGNASPRSDLDLAVFTSAEQRMSVFDLKEALEESTLPFRVELLIWDEIPESFHSEIERDHVRLTHD